LAHEHLLRGQPEIAVVFLKIAVNIYQTQRERISNIGSAELETYTKSVEGTYRGLASILTEQGRLDEAQLVLDMLKEDEQFEFVRRSANADPRRSRMAFNATEQAWTQRYRQVADRLAALGAEEVALQKQAKLGLTTEQQQRQKAVAADLAVARQAFQAFLDELRSSFAQKGPARAVEVVETSQKALRDLQSLLKGLGDDAVLLQYYITDDKVGMLLTTPGVQLARSSQVNAKDLNRQIGEFRRLLRDPKSNPQPAAQALYQLLVAPVAQDLAQAGAKTVMLSLDGALRYVPFAALHDGQQYLAQKWNLPMYTSVTRDKLRDAVAQEWQAAALGLTQAVGEFDALPAVRAEMRSIVKDGRTGVLPGEVHLDKAFSAARLKDVSQRPFQLLHVASHFRFSPGTEVNSFLLLGDGQQLTLGDIRTQNFRFDQVDLLTLSACDTGLGGGRDAQGREIEGFGVIAQQQGAKAVLATLWPVADQSTALLMADLYKRRQSQRLTKIEALRQAQLGLMAQPRYAHPFYWAPFILMGNWK
jgi:CHAT domain-containing protein